jgi:hypothetical protein
MRATQSMRTEPLKLRGLNPGDPVFWRSRMPSNPAFAFLPGLRYRPLGAKLFELCSGRFGQRGIPHLGPIP